MTDSKPGPSPGSQPPASGNVLDPAWETELRRGQEAEGEAGSVDPELEWLHLLRHSREPEALAPDQLESIWSAIVADPDAGLARAGIPWWRKAWVWWSAPALAAAAVLVVVVVKPGGEDAASVAVNDKAEEARADERGAPPSAAPRRTQTVDGLAASEAKPEAEEESAKSAKDFDSSAGEGDQNDQAPGAMGRGGGAASSSPFEVSFAKLAPHGRLAIRVGVDSSRDELRSRLLAKARGGG